MVGRLDDVKKGDLCNKEGGVHVPDPRKRTDRYEEPGAQQSERP